MNKKLIFITLLLFIIGSSLPSLLLCQQNTNNQTNREFFQYSSPEKGVQAPSYFFLIVKTIFILAIFGFGIYYIFKYISKKQGLSFPHLNIIKIISSVPVGTNRFIQVIEVGNRYYLIGSTDHNINVLSEITDKDTINQIKVSKNKQSERPQQPSFTNLLNNFWGGVSKKISQADTSKFLKKQKERLENLKLHNYKKEE